MTTTATNQPAKKKPPLTKAAREFLASVQLPPSNRSDRNIKISGLFGVMLLYAFGLKENAQTAACTPAKKQIARLLHCSISAVENLMDVAQDIGSLTSQRRGDGLSSIYTIHKTPVQTQPEVKDLKISQTQPDSSSDPSPPEVRPSQIGVQTHHLNSEENPPKSFEEKPTNPIPAEKIAPSSGTSSIGEEPSGLRVLGAGAPTSEPAKSFSEDGGQEASLSQNGGDATQETDAAKEEPKPEPYKPGQKIHERDYDMSRRPLCECGTVVFVGYRPPWHEIDKYCGWQECNKKRAVKR
jgi:hypothetical protein